MPADKRPEKELENCPKIVQGYVVELETALEDATTDIEKSRMIIEDLNLLIDYHKKERIYNA